NCFGDEITNRIEYVSLYIFPRSGQNQLPRINVNTNNIHKELESIRNSLRHKVTDRSEHISLHPIPDHTKDLLKQRPIIAHIHLENLETNNQLRNQIGRASSRER